MSRVTQVAKVGFTISQVGSEFSFHEYNERLIRR
jgi:urease beta subunit